jgi:DNA-binding MarR family transcriptional regulator
MSNPVYSSPVNELTCPSSPGVTAQLLRTAEKVERALEKALGEIGLSSGKLILLGGLVQAGGQLSLGELAAHRRCVKSNITKLVDRLEEDGLVRRRDDPADRRGVLAEITPEGRSRQAEGDQAARRIEDELTRGLTAEDVAFLRRVLEELAARSG